jgi:hypothetical protein
MYLLALVLFVHSCAAGNVTLHQLFRGDGVVLQSGAQGARVYGGALPSATVQLTLDGAPAGAAVADATGYWEAVLPAQAPSWHPFALVASDAAGGGVAAAARVRFGFTLLCAGQSNMELNNMQLANGTAEVEAAGAYSGKISLVSLQGFGRTSPPWNTSYFNAVSPGTGGTLAGYSGLCWLTGKAMFEALGGVAPVGLLMGAVGGTPIEAWLPPGVLGATCPADAPACGGAADTVLFESLIRPLAPFTLGALLWDQGERDVRCFSPATNRTAAYPCMEKALVGTWRSTFKSASAAFAAVQLPGYLGDCSEHGGDYYNCVPGVFNMRLAQGEGLAGVGNASAVPSYDLSCPFGIKTPQCPLGSVHNANKTVVAARAARALLAGMLPQRFPRVAPPQATAVTAAPTGHNFWLVTVAFEGGPLALGGTQFCDACCAGAVGDFDASLDGVNFVNGTAQQLSDGNVVFTVGLPQKPVLVRYTANQAFPQCAVLDSQSGLPAMPFLATVA